MKWAPGKSRTHLAPHIVITMLLGYLSSGELYIPVTTFLSVSYRNFPGECVHEITVKDDGISVFYEFEDKD